MAFVREVCRLHSRPLFGLSVQCDEGHLIGPLPSSVAEGSSGPWQGPRVVTEASCLKYRADHAQNQGSGAASARSEHSKVVDE
jgi:hypothetical protein